MLPDQDLHEAIRFHLKTATIHKRRGDWDNAVAALKFACTIANENGIPLEIKSRLRVPKYLAEAGKRDRAWAAFNDLIAEICTSGKDEWSASIDLMDVYHEMARFLRAERRFYDAFLNELLSVHWWGRSRYLMYKSELDRATSTSAAAAVASGESAAALYRKNAELAAKYANDALNQLTGILSDDGVEEFLEENLVNDELLSHKPALTSLFKEEADRLPEFDLTGFIDKIQSLFERR